MDTAIKFSTQTKNLRQSGIRSASVQCNALGGINLGQGLCDIPTHDFIKDAAKNAIYSDKNVYAPHDGIPELRQMLAKKIQDFNHVSIDPMTEILISHGSTGSFVSAVQVLFNPGDEVILFEPFYGYHHHLLKLFGVKTVSVTISDDYAIDFDQLKSAITSKTKGVVICTPCNPSGKIFTKEELMAIADMAEAHNLFIITDEIYEYITYPGYNHISVASLNNYKNRTVTISGFSKTYNITGWRIGYSYGPAAIIEKMALVHDLLYICPPTPLQHAMLTALQFKESYYHDLCSKFLANRELMVSTLNTLGFQVQKPQGAYYLVANFSNLGFKDDSEAAKILLEQAKVATVPGSAFYQDSTRGNHELRFCFALTEDKIIQALQNLTDFLTTK